MSEIAAAKKNQANPILDGVIWKGILSFFFPILLGTFFQQLYNTVDAIIVGQFLGKEALAAVGGGTSTIINLLIGFFTGLASGASVVISQRFGSGNMERVSKAIHTAIALSVVCGLVITVVGYTMTDFSLTLIDTPADVHPLASKYMKIYFAGSLTLVVYNMASGVFRALGDSRHPLYFLIAGCVTNIVLDIVTVGFLGMGVEGAAIATVFSQFVSVVLSIIWLRKLPKDYRLSLRKIAFDRRELSETLKIGVPAGIQSVMYSISNIIIQTNINSFGTDTAAAYSAYGKIDAAFWMVVNAFGIAITTFVGQNYGAGRLDRVKKGVNQTLAMAAAVTVVISLSFCVFSPSVSYANVSPAYISTRSWIRTILTTFSRSIFSLEYSESRRAITARCQACSASFSSLCPSVRYVRLSINFSLSISRQKSTICESRRDASPSFCPLTPFCILSSMMEITSRSA